MKHPIADRAELLTLGARAMPSTVGRLNRNHSAARAACVEFALQSQSGQTIFDIQLQHFLVACAPLGRERPRDALAIDFGQVLWMCFQNGPMLGVESFARVSTEGKFSAEP